MHLIVYGVFLLALIYSFLHLFSNQWENRVPSKRVKRVATLLVLIAIALFFFGDSAITNECVIKKTYLWGAELSTFFETFPMVVLLVTLFCYGYLKDKKSKFFKVTQIATLNFCIVLLIGAILKVLVMRERPLVAFDPHAFFYYQELLTSLRDSFFSLPSGHCLRLAAILLPYFLAYKNGFIRVIILLLLVMVMIARVAALDHWSSDVVLSMAIALVITDKVMKWLYFKRIKKRMSK